MKRSIGLFSLPVIMLVIAVIVVISGCNEISSHSRRKVITLQAVSRMGEQSQGSSEVSKSISDRSGPLEIEAVK